MKKGYEKLLAYFEKKFPTMVTLSGVKRDFPEIDADDLFQLRMAGFIDCDYNMKDRFGDHPHVINKEGFSHLNGLRALQVSRETERLTNKIGILTILLVILGIVQTLFFVIQALKS